MKKGEPKTLTYLSLVAVVLVLAGLAYAVVHNHMPVKETAWALTPPVIAIALALITKEVYSSLFLGILTGAFLNAGFDLVGTLNQVFQEGLLTVLSDKWNVGILIFLIILGMMVQLMNRTGGSAAFGQWASTHIKSRAGAQLATMLLGCLIFIDDYFNCLTVGSVMRPVTDKYNISRAKLAYLIDSTAAPVCIIAPISSWAAAVSGFVKGENGISIFVQSIPFNFYALLTLAMMVIIIPAVLGGAIAINWDMAFVVFHKLLFRNDYWLFDLETDPVITVLPDQFFMHVALVMIGVALLSCAVCLVAYIRLRHDPSSLKLCRNE